MFKPSRMPGVVKSASCQQGLNPSTRIRRWVKETNKIVISTSSYFYCCCCCCCHCRDEHATLQCPRAMHPKRLLEQRLQHDRHRPVPFFVVAYLVVFKWIYRIQRNKNRKDQRKVRKCLWYVWWLCGCCSNCRCCCSRQAWQQSSALAFETAGGGAPLHQGVRCRTQPHHHDEGDAKHRD